MFSANRASFIQREQHILEIRERFKTHSRHFILHIWDHVTLHLLYLPISVWAPLK
jgi:hypothetical protein